MKHYALTILMLLCAVMGVKAEVDPNFHVYICFGQSNMEGNAQWEPQDENNVDPRFQMLATCNFSSPKRTLGNWYKAECPIVSPVGKLGPTDYFGRTMVANLPENHRVGVIAVAMGGSPIEMFDKDKYQQKMADKPNEWWAQLARNYYGGNPYGRIIEMAKKAQQVGVIKGILLHQGCSNCGDPNWPNMVKKIYNDMLADLGLQAKNVPLFVGEVEYKGDAPQSGGCEGHNVQVDRIPEVIPTGYVVSAKGLPGNGQDPWHFSANGYRVLGKRYAQQVLRVIYDIDPEYEDPYIVATEKEIDLRFLALPEVSGKKFAIVNEVEGKALYCTYGRHLAYADLKTAFKETNSAYLFKIQKYNSGSFKLRLVSSKGDDYQVEGEIGYLNSPAINGDCCFIAGLNGKQNGYDIAKGAIWEIEYVDDKGFSIKNVGTDKYLKDAAHPAMFGEPTYFTFCTLKETAVTGIEDVKSNMSNVRDSIYTLDGRKVTSKNLRPGLYIMNGRKIVIK